jgi:hypothetical protein
MKRPYTTDYGSTQGHCETPKGAIKSAIRYLVDNGRKHAVIEREDGPPIDVWWNGHWGVTVAIRRGVLKRVK